MIVVASINAQWHWRGTAYSTTIGNMRGYAKLAILAPTWEMVMRYKRDHDVKAYCNAYYKLLETRRPRVEAWLTSLKADEDITLLCFCHEGAFCHRKLVAAIIRKYRPDITVEIH